MCLAGVLLIHLAQIQVQIWSQMGISSASYHEQLLRFVFYSPLQSKAWSYTRLTWELYFRKLLLF